MKTLPQIIQVFAAGSRNGKPARRRAAAEAAVKPPDQAAPQPACAWIAEDNGPPGHKIQWRH
jgi:hypothetical protein